MIVTWKSRPVDRSVAFRSSDYFHHAVPGQIAVVIGLNFSSNSLTQGLLQSIFAACVDHPLLNERLFWAPKSTANQSKKFSSQTHE